MAAIGITPVFSLRKIDSHELMRNFLALGFKTIVVCINEKFLDKSFCGRVIDEQFIKDLPANVDVCGENGEFHTFVFDDPIFKTPIKFTKGEIVYKQFKALLNNDDKRNLPIDTAVMQYSFWFCDLY